MYYKSLQETNSSDKERFPILAFPMHRSAGPVDDGNCLCSAGGEGALSLCIHFSSKHRVLVWDGAFQSGSIHLNVLPGRLLPGIIIS